MSKQNVNFKVNTNIDLDDLFVRRALFTRGGLWLWGSNYSVEFGGAGGQLGNNSSDLFFSSPIQTVSGGTNWKSVACGWAHTAAIKTDGTLWVWGTNSDDSDPVGQLGTNNSTAYSSPVQTVSAGTNWKQVSCGGQFTAAIKTDGSLWLWGLTGPTIVWGSNVYGELGTNNTTSRSSPVQTVSGGTNWKQVSGGYYHTAAIKTDGSLWLWGYNVYGQLGNNETADRSSPVQTVSGGTNWKSVACGYLHTAAIKTDGTLWTWGYNDSGELGDNTLVWRSSPVQTVSGGTNWKQVSAGNYITAAIKTDGTLWLWGINIYGQLGNNDGTGINQSSPIQTAAGGTNWKFVACGDFHTAAVYENN